MTDLPDHAPSCEKCANRDGVGFTVPFTMAFQPIFDIHTASVFAYEALVRPIGGGSAWDVLSRVDKNNRYSFDQKCRKKAISLAAKLGMKSRLSINFMPNAVYDPEHCIRATLWAAKTYNFPIENIIFEFIETEEIHDNTHLQNIVGSYKRMGFRTAIDDFGAGYAGLSGFCDLATDFIKIDMALLRNIDTDPRRQSVVKAILNMTAEMGVLCILEGVETAAEFVTLRALGGRYFQGYLLGRPTVEKLKDDATILARLRGADWQTESILKSA
ncbi:MAG: EAL domain-containing protein [Octadecabacter sp.]|nr:EAL domain-containing protein [Octadecabacter sp.]